MGGRGFPCPSIRSPTAGALGLVRARLGFAAVVAGGRGFGPLTFVVFEGGGGGGGGSSALEGEGHASRRQGWRWEASTLGLKPRDGDFYRALVRYGKYNT